MATLHVRNVPDELYTRIRERAETRNRSLSAEVVVLLSEALEGEISPREILSDIRRRRFFRPADVGAPDVTELLREDRKR
jgi:plasmid stability protein